MPKATMELKLNDKNRLILQIGVVVLVLAFLFLYLWNIRTSNMEPDQKSQIYLENSELHVFNDKYIFNGYPDKILFHYPYFIYVQGNNSKAVIYNLKNKSKEKIINEILLDYFDGNIVYNKKETFFNDKNLGKICDSAFTKSDNEVLCITKDSQDAIDNSLISINPDSPNLWKQIYKSDNLLTTVSVINNDLYIGEINYKTKQNYLSVNKKLIETDSPVNLIYEVDGEVYFISYNHLQAAFLYYIIENEIILKDRGKIYFDN